MIEAGLLVAAVAAAVAAVLAAEPLLPGRPRGRVARLLRRAALGAGAALLVLAGTYRLLNARTFQLFGEVVPRVETDAPVVALTFDDGPVAPHTHAVLDVLRQRGVRATFFVVGSALERAPGLGERLVRDGHELGNHSYAHRRMLFRTRAFIRAEIEATDALIRRAGFAGEVHFRSPYGKKLLLLPLYLRRTGRANILFDVEPETDPAVAADAGRIVAHVLARTRPGSIILLHAETAAREASRQALPGILDGLAARGFRFVTVSELLAARHRAD